MTTTSDATSLALEGTDLEPAAFRPSRLRAMTRGAVVIGVIVVAAVLVPWLTVSMKHDTVVEELDSRLSILASGRAAVAATWLEGTKRVADRVVGSDLFRGFATEVDAAGGDISSLVVPPAAQDESTETLGTASLAEQLPYMERVLADFANSADFQSAYLFNRRSDPFVASSGAPPVTVNQKRRAEQLFASGAAVYGPVRQTPAGLSMDVYLPVLSAQSEGADAEIVAALLLVTPVGQVLAEAVAPQPIGEAGEDQRVLQRDGESWIEIRPGEAEPLRVLRDADIALVDGTIPFALRGALDGNGRVYSVASAVSGPGWWMLQEIEARAAEAPVAGYRNAAVIVAILVVVAVIIAFGAFWWRMTSEHNESLAEQFRKLAGRIAAQKQLLDSINGSIADYIGLKALDGSYRYANPAFARAVGRDLDQVVGLDDAALFGSGTAQRLAAEDRRVLDTGVLSTSEEEIYLGSELHHLQISKVPFHDDGGQVTGIVAVMRDVTELVEQRQKRERAVQQMVASLVRAIELRDPYLAGHSRRVAGFAVEVAQRMGLSEAEQTTVELAANLSQIGKLAIPKELLNKPERLNDREIEQMQDHIEHAAAILRDIDFELPVLETIYQMHERLDGGGYPKALRGGEILLTAQILGACDVFCARIEPRSYRAGIAPKAALEVLEQNSGRYDPSVVEALGEVVRSVTGEKLIAGVAAA